MKAIFTEYWDKQFSIRELSTRLCISQKTLRCLHRQGRLNQQSIDRYVKERDEYKAFAEKAVANGLRRKTFYQRVLRGQSLDEASK